MNDYENINNYILVTDATLDLPADLVDEIDLKVIPMSFEIDGNTYHHYPDERELAVKDFYAYLREGKISTTAQVTPFMYEEVFKEYLKEGMDVLCVVFSSGLSGTCQSAKIAAEKMREKYPDSKIYCLDSRAASIGLGVLTYHAARKRREGMDIDTLCAWIMENRHNARHWFKVDDLFHLNRGGRLSSFEAVVGTALKIKPILSVDEAGKLIVVSKARGTKKAVAYIVDKLKEEATDAANQTVFVGHGDNLEEALGLKERLLSENLVKDVVICNIGPIIGTHTGPGMLALSFMH